MTKGRSRVTKQKLLAAAGEIFTEKGFRDTTVAEICARAKANISAVNYHFGSKKALYQETWRHSLAESLKKYPMDGGVSASASAEERLRGQLTSLIYRISDENNKELFITQMEIINPTGLLNEVMEAELIPMRKQTLALVRELLGPEATEQQVHYCEISIVSMCVRPLVMQRIARRIKNKHMPAIIEDIEAFADHVVEFALAGINVIRNKESKS